MDGPDLEGFRDAQVTLREQFSQDVPFFIRTPTTYPPGTQIDPESGVPYDPTIAPTASGYTMVVASAEVFHGRQDASTAAEEVATAIGEIEEGKAVLALDPDAGTTVDAAEYCEFDGKEWRITAARSLNGVGPLAPDRLLVWVEKR